jgi:hypothetical protein
MYRPRPTSRSSAWQQVALLVVFTFIFIYASW